MQATVQTDNAFSFPGVLGQIDIAAERSIGKTQPIKGGAGVLGRRIRMEEQHGGVGADPAGVHVRSCDGVAPDREPTSMDELGGARYREAGRLKRGR